MYPKDLNDDFVSIWELSPMLVIDQKEKEEYVIRIHYSALTMEEVLYLLTNYYNNDTSMHVSGRFF
jgi:hypothetical protein